MINVQKNRKNVDLPLQLITLLTKELNLSVEGNTDAFHRHTLFPEWYSEFLEDSWFGSHGTSLEMSLQGSNTYLNLLNSSESFINLMLSKVVAHLASEPPTRTLVVGKREHLDKFINDVRIMKILDLKLHGVDVSLVLALNKASLVVDPIKWSLLISEIRGCGEMHQITVTFSESTDAMFRERQIPVHPPRSQQQENPSKLFPFLCFGPPSIQKFFTGPTASIHPIVSSSDKALIRKINAFDPKLLILGILPNQLRTLAKAHSMNNVEESLTLLSETLFWEGYEIWKRRKTLVANFWKNIAPKDWSISKKEKKKTRRYKMKPNCKNPFHTVRKYTT